MPLLRCQAVLKNFSGLPADNVVNTFHVVTPTTDAVLVEGIAERIRNFYTVDNSANVATDALMQYLGQSVADTGHEIRVYEIDRDTNTTTPAPDLPPIWVETFDLVGRAALANGNPHEVAVCLSYKSDEAPTVPQARRRGRIYFGPLKTTGVVAAGTDRQERVSSTFRTALLENAVHLRNQIQALNAAAEWVIYSRPYEGRDAIPRTNAPDLPAIPARPGATYSVDRFWVDDAFDTQRRRGVKASARSSLA